MKKILIATLLSLNIILPAAAIAALPEFSEGVTPAPTPLSPATQSALEKAKQDVLINTTIMELNKTTSGSRSGFEVTEQKTTSQNGGTQIISIPNPLGSIKTIPELLGRLVDWLIFIASVAILPLMIIYGAYQMLTAGGNPEGVTSARHTITWAVIGYALLLISKGAEMIIRDILTRGA